MTRQCIHQVWLRWGDGVSILTYREVPPRHVRCACGGNRRVDGMTAHRQEPEHQDYERARFLRRFWSWAAVRENGCWEWTGPAANDGYGRLSTNRGRPLPDGSVAYDKGNEYAHRRAYELAIGPIPDGLTIDHLCRNHGCVNPAHLEAVTQRENTLRSPIAPAAINARKTHCPQGHPYSPENTWRTRNGRGRQCRACHTAEGRRQRARRKARSESVA